MIICIYMYIGAVGDGGGVHVVARCLLLSALPIQNRIRSSFAKIITSDKIKLGHPIGGPSLTKQVGTPSKHRHTPLQEEKTPSKDRHTPPHCNTLQQLYTMYMIYKHRNPSQYGKRGILLCFLRGSKPKTLNLRQSVWRILKYSPCQFNPLCCVFHQCYDGEFLFTRLQEERKKVVSSIANTDVCIADVMQRHGVEVGSSEMTNCSGQSSHGHDHSAPAICRHRLSSIAQCLSSNKHYLSLGITVSSDCVIAMVIIHWDLDQEFKGPL